MTLRSVWEHYGFPVWYGENGQRLVVEMKSLVLQTCPVYEQHTSEHQAERLYKVVSEWKLVRPGQVLQSYPAMQCEAGLCATVCCLPAGTVLKYVPPLSVTVSFSLRL